MALNLINNSPLILHILYFGLGGHSADLFSLLEAGFMNEAKHTILFIGVEEPTKDSLVDVKISIYNGIIFQRIML